MPETSVEKPFHVLLEDDRLISKVSVETDRLLAATTPDDVRLTIRVRTRVAKGMWANLGLG